MTDQLKLCPVIGQRWTYSCKAVEMIEEYICPLHFSFSYLSKVYLQVFLQKKQEINLSKDI